MALRLVVVVAILGTLTCGPAHAADAAKLDTAQVAFFEK